VVDFACGLKPATRQRKKVVPLATGRVLEIGIGSGLNLPFYDTRKVRNLWGLDPSKPMWAMAEKMARTVDIEVEFLEASAEQVPLADAVADTVLVTYSLCTIPDALSALREMKRVLKPGGRLIFCEHGEAPDEGVRRWQQRLNPVWKKLGGGCNLDRPIPSLLTEAGFDIGDLQTMYLPGWKPASFNYWGTAGHR
jgi:ubiquinone/menaquinone biosynthesis C-methylase UbiE